MIAEWSLLGVIRAVSVVLIKPVPNAPFGFTDIGLRGPFGSLAQNT